MTAADEVTEIARESFTRCSSLSTLSGVEHVTTIKYVSP
jgi:hypothetical protein